jgi:Mor family transcriptional regulator
MNRRQSKSVGLLSFLADLVDEEVGRGTDRLGERVIARLKFAWQNEMIYIPLDLARRNREICKLFNGKNYDALAKYFGMSSNTVRRIVSSENNAQWRERQAHQ